MSKYKRRQLWFYIRRALLILCGWTVIYFLIFFFEYFTLQSYNALTSAFDLYYELSVRLIIALTSGLVGGFFTINLMEYWLRRYAFWKALLLITITFILAAILISGLAAYYYFVQHDIDGPDSLAIKDQVLEFLSKWRFIKELIIWLSIVLGTLVVLLVNDKYGPGVFMDYILGRYFMPKTERRIFMFADIKDATTIAERLGEEKYFNFLKHFFNDIAPAIIQTRGEVYQYVGDEVVLTWKMKHGLKNANALRCFYEMKRLLATKKNRYIELFDAFPKFKVGFHYGSVTVGELGKIKRDIAFSGDVLNTAARIQSKCNEKEVDNLASATFANLLVHLPEGVEKLAMGEEPLKGKSGTVALVTFISTPDA